MSYNTKKLITDAGKKPISQYYDAGLDEYGASQGSDGAIHTKEIGSNKLTGSLLLVTVPGTAVPLPNIPCREVTVIARRTNSKLVFSGASDVSAQKFGADLAAKESFTYRVSNANLIWIDAEVSGEGISYVAI